MENNQSEIIRRMLIMVKDKDPIFMYLQDEIIDGLISWGFIIKESDDGLNGTCLTKKGNEFLSTFN